MKRAPTLLILPCLCLLGMADVSKAGDSLQSHTSIILAVETFLKNQTGLDNPQQIEIEVGHIDSRLQLHACESALETFLAPGHKTLGKAS